ncbi:hypothetical protein BUALT_Bualt07G0135100 [Buddleja alternifolia]|uniref:DUF4283 domain-containing protein n=1 Tax=Buddleja alternifolia TaxID=168488 RepID=A0AAV6XBG0_9LAMI|nr:hypothetical protein BUALT_Bualt07G0135100 [Buddleja alternifolia]
MAAPFQYSLVGKFSHGYPTMTRLRAKFAALGLLMKDFKIGVLDNKHVWIRLFDSNDYTRIWLKQMWYFDGFPMRVLKWTPDFDPKEESPIMPIWVKILGLKPHWFHRQFLYHVASLIGKPLKLDESTTVIDNPTVARICIEINVLDRLQQDIPVQVEGKMCYLKLQYEGIPQYCSICRHRGHTISSCLASMEKTVSAENSVGLEDLTAPIWLEKGDLRGEGWNVNGEKNNLEKNQNMVDENESQEDEDNVGNKEREDKSPDRGGFNTENGGEKFGDQHDNNMELVSFLEEIRNLMYLGNNIQVPDREEDINYQENEEEPWT